MGITEKVADFIVALRFEDIPPQGIASAKTSLLDTIGTALVGASGPVGAVVADFVSEMGGNPQARLLGSGVHTSVLNAALANGTAAHADDYDDIGSFGHAGVVLTPVALALGEHLKLSGRQILEGYAVGYEIGYKLVASMGEVQIEGGFHSTSVLGTVAAAAEAAKLMGLDALTTRMALGIAASLASGVMQNFGTYTKPLHAGHAARSGIAAATLAKKGLTADPSVFEGRRGFAFVFGQEQCVVGRITENIGQPLAIAAHGVSVKPWPCCGGNHEALTAIFGLINRYDIQPEEVEQIEVATSWRPPGPVLRTDPQCAFEGRFSLQYNMAAALMDRKIDLDTYSDERFRRPQMQSLMRRIRLVWHPECADTPLRLRSATSGFGSARFVVVTLWLSDGRILSSRQDREGCRRLRGGEVFEKYRSNAAIGGLPDAEISHSIELVQGLEGLADVTELVDVVASGKVAAHIH